MQRISWNHSIALPRYCNRQNTPDAPNFWLANQIFHNNCICIYVLSFWLSYVLSYLFHFLSLQKSLVYPAFVHILYNECSEDMTGEYSSAKYLRSNWVGTLGAIAPPLREKSTFSKGIQKKIFHLVLLHFNFWLAI